MFTEYTTTPGVIKMYQDKKIPCDQATVSCLARQGRFKADKIHGSWVIEISSVRKDIDHLLKVREGHDADQQT